MAERNNGYVTASKWSALAARVQCRDRRGFSVSGHVGAQGVPHECLRKLAAPVIVPAPWIAQKRRCW